MDLFQVATPLVVFSVLAPIVLVTLAVTACPGRYMDGKVAAARRRAVLISAFAVILGLASAALTVTTEVVLPVVGRISGLGQLLAPIAFGLAHTVVIGLGNLPWLRTRSVLRRAGLAPRSIYTIASGWLGRLAVTSVLLAVGVIVVGILISAPDGRTIGYGLNQGPGVILGDITTGPFPGPALGIPALISVAMLSAVCIGTLGIIAIRPAGDGDADSDHTLRRASAHRALRGTTAAVLVVDSGLLFYAGAAAATAFPQGNVHFAGLVVSTLGAVTGLVALAILCVHAPRLGVGASSLDSSRAIGHRIRVLS